MSERASSFLLQRGALPQRRESRPDRELVLFFNSMFGDPPELRPDGLPNEFELTADLRRFREASAVVFHLPTLSDIRRLSKPAGQLWIAWWMESRDHFPQLADPALMSRFDLTMSHHRDSDLVITYLDLTEIREENLRAAPVAKEATVALFLSGADDTTGREAYAAELMRHLDVHSFGRLLRTHTLANDRGDPTKLETIARYKFTLAFENASEPDYVTEKLYQPLAVGSVPVYLGAPNVAELVPSRDCFIDVRDFSGPKALADHLGELDRDSVAYERHLEWKKRAFLPTFQQLLEASRTHPFVRLCDLLRRRPRARASWR